MWQAWLAGTAESLEFRTGKLQQRQAGRYGHVWRNGGPLVVAHGVVDGLKSPEISGLVVPPSSNRQLIRQEFSAPRQPGHAVTVKSSDVLPCSGGAMVAPRNLIVRWFGTQRATGARTALRPVETIPPGGTGDPALTGLERHPGRICVPALAAAHWRWAPADRGQRSALSAWLSAWSGDPGTGRAWMVCSEWIAAKIDWRGAPVL